jgi:predicted amidophosphoribosyltransferase
MRCRERCWSFDEALPLFPYEGPMGRVLAEYKARGRRSLAPFLAELCLRALEERWPGRAVVPVPPRPGKLRAKGWDQVEAVARLLELRGLTLSRSLRRLAASQQKRLGREARAANARAGYSLIPGAAVPRSLVILDDVVTTCATAEACAAALRAAGATEIAFLALACD